MTTMVPSQACPEGYSLTQCPVRRARTSSPDVIFPEIWLMLVLPPKKGCRGGPGTDRHQVSREEEQEALSKGASSVHGWDEAQ
jgi:hypothetical protein